MNEQKKDSRIIPTDEIVAEKIAITEAINKECADWDKLEQLNIKNEELNDKYKFFDIVFDEDGKKGLKDIAGNVRVPALYYDFCETYAYGEFRSLPVAAFDANNKCALVKTDGTGTPLCPFDFDYIGLIDWTHFFIAKKGNKCAILDCNGNMLVEPIIDVYHETLNGVTCFESNGKYGLITNNGLYVAPIYDDMNSDDTDNIYVTLGEKKGYLDYDDGHFIDENDKEECDCCDFISWSYYF